LEARNSIQQIWRHLDHSELGKRGEVKWLTILQQGFRDVVMLGFGAWIIYKQVYAINPNAYLAAIGFACMFPAARSAVVTILSAPGQSLPSSPQQEERQSQPSQSGGIGDGAANKQHQSNTGPREN
jgi:hypothetical protein